MFVGYQFEKALNLVSLKFAHFVSLSEVPCISLVRQQLETGEDDVSQKRRKNRRVTRGACLRYDDNALMFGHTE